MDIGRREAMVQAVRNLMDSMRMTQEQAMKALKIPESERSEYANKIK